MMPPPILNDSEDEEDDVVYDDSVDSRSRSSGESAPGIPALDGTRDTHDQSTGSTDRLKRQIDDAQRNLCGDSSGRQQTNDRKPAHPGTISPSLRRDKRRSSASGHFEPAMSTVKRSKTTNTTTYGGAPTKRLVAETRQREQFSNVFGEDATAPNTSPSIRFSDHSGVKNSSALPVGSFHGDFAHHEPAMFKESGSTIPDNESSHERMVEQALRSKSVRAPSSPGIKLVESDEMPKSSSFPWSASEQAEVARSNIARDEHTTVPEPGVDNDTTRPPEPEDSGQYAVPMPINEDIPVPGPATAVMVAPITHNEPHRSSPTVHINPVEISAASVAQPEAVSGDKTQKASRGRKRKVQEVQEVSSEPLNSDDIAVGLPKERYLPRPSRRRATSTIEESIDYSVVPEKAAKSKRSKTMGSSANLPDTQPQLTSNESPKAERKTKLAKNLEAAECAIATASNPVANDTLIQTPAQFSRSSPVVEVPATIETPAAEPKETISHSAAKATPEDKKPIILDDDLAFEKPAPKKKLASKSKRSATTIFEDHVDFAGKSKSPSLSQQQAMRKSALKDVKNDASPAKRKRSGKAVILYDDDEDEEENLPVTKKVSRKVAVADDDEDELAFDPQSQDDQADEPPDEPPKKRGRGRPSKAASKADAEAIVKSAKQVGHTEIEVNVQPALEKPAKKRGRGRPPKSAASVPVEDESTAADDTGNNQLEPNQDEEKVSAENLTETPTADSTQSKQNSATVIPTPSPEKQPSGETRTASDKNIKASPAAHSPIKSSSPAPFRVGLSKKHRIPSLLRVMRPPPAKLPSKR
ncbi:hypothetical protein Q7P35_000226 [Cladosporium inversicolor]